MSSNSRYFKPQNRCDKVWHYCPGFPGRSILYQYRPTRVVGVVCCLTWRTTTCVSGAALMETSWTLSGCLATVSTSAKSQHCTTNASHTGLIISRNRGATTDNNKKVHVMIAAIQRDFDNWCRLTHYLVKRNKLKQYVYELFSIIFNRSFHRPPTTQQEFPDWTKRAKIALINLYTYIRCTISAIQETGEFTLAYMYTVCYKWLGQEFRGKSMPRAYGS